MVGKSLGHYEILDPLGSGGMGDVYRAHDTTLNRDVAIKVLPEDLADDPDRLARLKREAHLLATLNHPNIATIHALEESEAIRFLVMELVKGESLEQRLTGGRLPVNEALDICRQIAEALEAAHEEGIIHRDLKPANVLVTPDGRAKVLDFGLAKTVETATSSADISRSPTVTVAGTQAGVILGTAPYMSPEQVRGKPLDKRADIWAFGCVLFETLAGHRAFNRETVADTLAAVLETDPDWGSLSAATPVIIQSLLRRCLRKDPRRRLHDIADARIEIEEAAAEPAGEAEARAGAPAARPSRWRLAVPWALVVVMAVIATGALYRISTVPDPRPRPYVEFSLDGSFGAGGRQRQSPAISPDGDLLVYPLDGRLYRKSLSESGSDPVPVTEEGGNGVFFSPDGEEVGFVSGGQLWRAAVQGGGALLICDIPSGGLRGASWGSDGTIVFGEPWGGLWRVSEDGGNLEEITTPARERGEISHRWPQVLPGGRVLFNIHHGGNFDYARIAVWSEDGRKEIPDVQGAYPRYVPGYLLYARSGTLIAAPFDIDRLEVTGGPTAVLDDVWVDSPGAGVAHYSVSDFGVLVYQRERQGEREMVLLDRFGGEPTVLPGFEPRFIDNVLDLSPDGRYLTFSDEYDVFVHDLQEGHTQRLVSDRNNNVSPVWGPGGGSIVFSSNLDGPYDLFRFDIADRQVERVVGEAATNFRYVSSVSENGTVLYQQQNPETSWDIYAVSPEGSPQPLVVEDGLQSGAVFSPDGKHFAFHSRGQVWVRPYPDTASGQGQRASTGTGSRPVWGRDGKELFYVDGRRLMVVKVITDPEYGLERAEELLILDPTLMIGGQGFPASYDVTPEGDFVFARVVRERPPAALIVGVNWFEELKRLVSGGR